MKAKAVKTLTRVQSTRPYKLLKFVFWLGLGVLKFLVRLLKKVLRRPYRFLQRRVLKTWERKYMRASRRAAKFLHHHALRRPHLHLSKKFNWYRRYHEWRYHHHLHVGIAATELLMVLVMIFSISAPVFADVTETWLFGTPSDFTFDSGLEVNGTSIRHKAQNYTNDVNTMGLWHLDEASGTAADDSSSNNNDGTISGGTFGTGNLNNGLTLDGTDDLFSAADSTSLSLTGQNSLEGWIKPRTAISAGSSNQRQSIIDKGSYQLYINNETGKLTYELANSTATTWSRAAGNEEGGSWSSGTKDQVRSSVAVGSNIYVGLAGNTGDADVYKWDGSAWSQVAGDGINGSWSAGTFEQVTDLATDGTNIYAGLGTGTGDGEVWRWSGSGNWTKIGGDAVNSSWAVNLIENVNALQWHNSKLYAATGIGNSDGHVWEWNGTSWTQVAGNGSANSSWSTNNAFALASGGGKLYAGLGGSAAGEVWEWSGSGAWTKIADDTTAAPGLSAWGTGYEFVRSLVYHNGKLYAGLGDTSNDAEVWEWNGTNDWTQIGGDSLNSGWTTGYDYVLSMASDGTSLYAGLGLTSAEGEVWKYTGGTWSKIGDQGLNNFPSGSPDHVGDLMFSGSTLYASTFDTDRGGHFASWNGTTWTTLGGQYINNSWGFTGLSSVENIYSMGGYMYAATSGATNRGAMVWRYDGSTWQIIGGQSINSSWVADTYETVPALTGHNGKLYAGLGDNTAGDGEVWEWNGSSWTRVGGDGVNSSWPDSTYEIVSSLASYNGKLYAGLGNGSGDGEIWEWNGTNDWTQVAGDLVNSSWNSTPRNVTTMTVFNGKLYAGTGIVSGDGEVWEWNGTNDWTQVGGDDVFLSWPGAGGNAFNSVQAMVNFRGKLYVGLGLGTDDAEVWEWTGVQANGSWTKIAGDGQNSSWSDNTYEVVNTLAVYNGEIYAGLGSNTGESEVWRWNGSVWSKLGGTGQNNSWTSQENVDSFGVYKGKLYAGIGNTTSNAGEIWTYGNNGYLESTTSSWDTNWHHVAATYDGSTMRLFIDGSASGTANANLAMPDGSQPLMIGTGHGARDMSKPQPRFDGQLDEIRISNTARSSFTTKPYVTTAQTVSPNNPVFTTGMVAWTDFVESVTLNGGSVSYRLSTNNGTSWMYWSGSAWATSANLSQVSAASTIHTHIATLPVVLGGGIKWQAVIQGDGSQRVTLNSVSISGASDAIDPAANAASITMQKANGGASVSSNGWSNGSSPYFAWTAGSDAESGLYGYCLYLGQTENSDPQTTKGILGTSPLSTTGTNCQFIVPANSVDLATSGLIATPLATSNTPYYLYVKAIDNAGNVFNTSAAFQFRFDNTPPDNPAYITTPSQFLATKTVEITWPSQDSNAPDDSHSGLAGLQYRIGSGGTWYGDSHSGTQDATDLLTNDGAYTTVDPPDFANLADGNNNIYFRTWDVAGNVSTTYVTGVIKLNTEGSPSEPQGLQVNPSTNTVNSFAFSWSAPVQYVGSASNLTYCYTVNSQPSPEICEFTSPGITSLPAGPYATQPGQNIFYVVAKDESGAINYAAFAQIPFTANTSAPGIPLNIDIADISIKSSNKWRLTLSWEEPDQVGAGVATYRIYRSTDNVTFGLLASTSGTSYVDTNLSQVKYYYKVRACDSANNCGVFSSTVNDTPTGKFTVAANLVTDPAISGISTRRATLSWSTDRASDSRISFGTKPGDYFPTELANSEQVTTHILELNNLSAGTTYYYQAKWTDEDGNTGSSAEGSFTTAPAPTIKDVEAFDVNLSTATVRFTARGATKAKIYYGRSEGFGGSIEQKTSTTESTYSVDLDALEDGTKYFFKINTFDSDNNEYDGNIFSFTTPARPRISSLRFQPVEGEPTSTQKVTWTTNVPTSSVVLYSTPGQPSKEVSNSSLVTEHEIIIQGLLDDSEYTLTAQSRDGTGNIAVSDAQVFRTSLDTRPPKVFDVVIDDSIRGTGSEARGQIIVSWKTDEPSTSQVAYGEGIGGGTYTTRTVEDTNLVTDHLVIVSDLPTSRTFHLVAVSRDKSTNEGQSEDHTTIIGRASESVIGIIFNALQKVFAF